jgi:GTP-binding protein
MVIAIVGRPNVGKSALFNRIVRKRIAIVHDEPGVTRDRITVQAEWNGRTFTLIDTGGIGLLRGEKATDVITQAALQQVELAIESSDVIIFVVNVQEGIVPLDHEVAERLRQFRKPTFLVVNKVDDYRAEHALGEFEELGFQAVFPVSAIHGTGIDDLMDAAMKALPGPGQAQESAAAETDSQGDSETGEEEAPIEPTEVIKGPLKIAIVGRPNVGKSSIINSLTQSERVIVSPIPGTTRDAVDVPFEVETEGVRQQYILIDTAGVRQERRIDNSIEFFSVKRTEESIARADLVVFVIDAEAGVTAQDKKVAGKIIEERRSCILVVNKWDLVKDQVLELRKKEIERREQKEHGHPKVLTTLSEFGTWVQEQMFFLDYAPVIFTSAKTGFHLDRLLEAIRYVAAQMQQKIPTAVLNRTLADAITRRQPVSAQGHLLKFYYATQVKQAPPTFLLFVNRDEIFSDSYAKYLSGEMRKAFGFEGCPLVLVPRARPKTIESKRLRSRPGKPQQSEERRRDRKGSHRRGGKAQLRGGPMRRGPGGKAPGKRPG